MLKYIPQQWHDLFIYFYLCPRLANFKPLGAGQNYQHGWFDTVAATENDQLFALPY